MVSQRLSENSSRKKKLLIVYNPAEKSDNKWTKKLFFGSDNKEMIFEKNVTL